MQNTFNGVFKAESYSKAKFKPKKTVNTVEDVTNSIKNICSDIKEVTETYNNLVTKSVNSSEWISDAVLITQISNSISESLKKISTNIVSDIIEIYNQVDAVNKQLSFEITEQKEIMSNSLNSLNALSVGKIVAPSTSNYHSPITSTETDNTTEVTESTNSKNNTSQDTGSSIDIPSNVRQSGITKNYTNYDYFYNKWSKGTNQRSVADAWAESGKNSNNGIATIDDRYLVAVSTKFGKVGDNIDVVLDDGTVINCTIADAKGSDATSEWGHELGRGGVDVIEWESVGSADVINIDEWQGKKVTSIINIS